MKISLNYFINKFLTTITTTTKKGGMKPNTVMLGFYDNILPEDLLKNRMFRKKRRLLNYGLTSSASNGTLNQNGSLYNFDGACSL